MSRNTDFGEEAYYFITVVGVVLVTVTEDSIQMYLSSQS